MVYYIHRNPINHNICNNLDDYHWSSYNLILDDKSYFLKTDEVLQWFGGKGLFIQYHMKC